MHSPVPLYLFCVASFLTHTALIHWLIVGGIFGGRAHAELRWWRKDAETVDESARELEFSKVGRKARMEGRTEALEVPPRPEAQDRYGAALAPKTYETERFRYPGFDIYAVEAEWREWSSGKDAPRDPEAAFLAFSRKFAEANPL